MAESEARGRELVASNQGEMQTTESTSVAANVDWHEKDFPWNNYMVNVKTRGQSASKPSEFTCLHCGMDWKANSFRVIAGHFGGLQEDIAVLNKERQKYNKSKIKIMAACTSMVQINTSADTRVERYMEKIAEKNKQYLAKRHEELNKLKCEEAEKKTQIQMSFAQNVALATGGSVASATPSTNTKKALNFFSSGSLTKRRRVDDEDLRDARADSQFATSKDKEAAEDFLNK